MQNIKKYHYFITLFARDFKKSAAISQCKNYSVNNTEISGQSILNTSKKIHNFGVWRGFKTSYAFFSEESDIGGENEKETNTAAIDPLKDRTRIIPPETSIRYLKSEAYKTTYGDEPVWVKYRRNFKGQFVPKTTRPTCIVKGIITTGNPCPICRDEYLVLHYTNVDLLKQFIRPETGKMYDSRRIHVCQRKLLELEVAIKKAKFYGYITYDVPFRKYDYSEYYTQWKEEVQV